MSDKAAYYLALKCYRSLSALQFILEESGLMYREVEGHDGNKPHRKYPWYVKDFLTAQIELAEAIKNADLDDE